MVRSGGPFRNLRSRGTVRCSLLRLVLILLLVLFLGVLILSVVLDQLLLVRLSSRYVDWWWTWWYRIPIDPGLPGRGEFKDALG